MSVGKTTLVNALKKVPEFKGYTTRTERSKELMEMGIPLNTDSTLKGQTIFLAERVTELIQENIVTDRTILDVIAFTKCANKVNIIDSDAFEKYAKRFIFQYDYIFYISPKGIDVEDNGIRETNIDYRNKIDKTIQRLLLKHGPIYHELIGSTDERIEQILKIIKS